MACIILYGVHSSDMYMYIIEVCCKGCFERGSVMCDV